jgi:hypothetical protein
MYEIAENNFKKMGSFLKKMSLVVKNVVHNAGKIVGNRNPSG